jgi:hypothetical protein
MERSTAEFPTSTFTRLTSNPYPLLSITRCRGEAPGVAPAGALGTSDLPGRRAEAPGLKGIRADNGKKQPANSNEVIAKSENTHTLHILAVCALKKCT